MPVNAASGTRDEASRQHALDRYRIVDSLPEGAYDDIVQIASTVCETPIAVLTLLDRDRQWFKARVGLDADETPRSQAVCDHAIRQPGQLMEVPDLAGDPRFADFPVVTAMGARFYAGMPLVTPEGDALGTVCVLGHEPRELTPDQRAALAGLARLAMHLLEARAREREQELAAVLLSASPDAIADADQADSSAQPGALPYAIAILELQGHAYAVQQRGERGVEKELHQLEGSLDGVLRRDLGDTINRVTGSAEFVAVLHGDDIDDRLRTMERVLGEHRRRSGLNVLLASAHAESASEATQLVFMRADAGLSALKDQLSQTPRAA